MRRSGVLNRGSEMKTAETVALEKAIRRATYKMGTFGCYEVTIGYGGKERVDYMTYDTKAFSDAMRSRYQRQISIVQQLNRS